MEGIPLRTLPKTFQDAVKITPALDFRFLLIDSLCIIQDDTEVWEAESTAMALVYRNSHFTIAATASKNGDSRCFRYREHIPYIRVGDMGGREVLGIANTIISQKPNDWERSICRAALNQRAWVIQERILSRRMVHYAEDQLYWDCQFTAASEN